MRSTDPMARWSFLLILLVLTGVSESQERESSFELRVGETARVAEADFSLTFEEVESDSRCPEDVDCFWAGEAVLVFHAQSADGQSKRLELKVPPGGRASAPFRSHEIEVRALEPQTSSERRIELEDYIAEVSVRSDAGR